MPRGDKGRRFEKGNTIGKLGGRPPADPEVKELRQLDRQDLEKLVRETFQMTEYQMQKKLADKECPAKDRLAIRIIMRGIAKGDPAVLGFLTDYVFGPQAKKIHFEGNVNSRVANVSQEQIEDAIKKLQTEF